MDVSSGESAPACSAVGSREGAAWLGLGELEMLADIIFLFRSVS